jgi:hypothetical protein
VILKSFGCSLIFGSELADDAGDKPSQLTWPAHLSTKLNKSYECFASPGAGNLQILEQILNQIVDSNCQDLFVIGWSWKDRFDYFEFGYDPIKNQNSWSSIIPTDESDVAHQYYKILHSEYKDKLCSLVYIKAAIDMLNQKQIPFIMTYMDSTIFDQHCDISNGVIDLQNYIKPFMTTFEGMNFLDWSQHHQYPITKNWHPLELAHTNASQYIFYHKLTQQSKIK